MCWTFHVLGLVSLVSCLQQTQTAYEKLTNILKQHGGECKRKDPKPREMKNRGAPVEGGTNGSESLGDIWTPGGGQSMTSGVGSQLQKLQDTVTLLY